MYHLYFKKAPHAQNSIIYFYPKEKGRITVYVYLQSQDTIPRGFDNAKMQRLDITRFRMSL